MVRPYTSLIVCPLCVVECGGVSMEVGMDKLTGETGDEVTGEERVVDTSI